MLDVRLTLQVAVIQHDNIILMNSLCSVYRLSRYLDNFTERTSNR
jgi:hypothetical protein